LCIKITIANLNNLQFHIVHLRGSKTQETLDLCWQSPEEFLECERRYSGDETNRLGRLQIKDPMQGIEASYIQLQNLKERMEIFVKRVIEYYK
jgi:hypothetical protein